MIDSGINSDAIELGDNHIVVIRVIDHKAATTKPLDEVREEIIADIKQDRAREELKQVGQTIVTQLESGTAPEQVTTDVEISWNNEEGVKRDATTVTRSVLRTAFEMGKPGEKPLIKGYSLGSGDYAIVLVSGVQDGDVEEVAETTSVGLTMT